MTSHSRFKCTLARSDEPECTHYARVTITDETGDSARACPRHAVAALDGIDGARVDWTDTRGLNEFERKALELTEEINRRPQVSVQGEREPEPEAARPEAEPHAELNT
jgi:hypothetical protein